jgi:hypothetical protein
MKELNLRINKKQCKIMKIMKKALMKPENRKSDGIKIMNQYKYLGLSILKRLAGSQQILFYNLKNLIKI